MENKKKQYTTLADERMQQTLEQAMQEALQSEEHRERLKTHSSSDEIPIEFVDTTTPMSEDVVFLPEQPTLMETSQESHEPVVVWEQQSSQGHLTEKLEAVEQELRAVREERDSLLKSLQSSEHQHHLLEARISQIENNLRRSEQEQQNTEKERQQLYERLLRLSADFDNLRKRTAREKEEMRMYGHEGVMRDLISILDNFDRALDAMKDAPDSVRSGMDMVYKQFLDTLGQHGVVRFVSKGEPFDYTLHEALTVIESNEVPSNTVLEEFQAGYRFHERLLRPARVAVSKATPPPRPVVQAEEQQDALSDSSDEVEVSVSSGGGGTMASGENIHTENPGDVPGFTEPLITSEGGEQDRATMPEIATLDSERAASLAADLTVEFSEDSSSSAKGR